MRIVSRILSLLGLLAVVLALLALVPGEAGIAWRRAAGIGVVAVALFWAAAALGRRP